jgi:hypothetical protein
VPIFAGLFDYLENILVVIMIFSYPDISQNLVMLSSVATIVKSGLTTIFFLLLFYGFLRLWIGPDNS